MSVNTSRRGGSIPVGACAFGAEGRMASIGPSALGAKGCIEGVHRFAQGKRPWWAAPPPVCRKLSQPPFGRGKTCQPRLRRVGNAPLLPTAPLHGKASHEIFSRLMAPYKFRSLATPEGEVLAALCLELLLSLKAERRANFPLRGGKGTGFVGKRSDPKIQ